MDLLDANIILSTIFLATSITILWIGFFFLLQPETMYNKLRNIMTHIFLAWGAHFAVVGLQMLFEVFFGHALLSLASMRLISSLLVLIEFIALLRLYVYIRNHHD